MMAQVAGKESSVCSWGWGVREGSSVGAGRCWCQTGQESPPPPPHPQRGAADGEDEHGLGLTLKSV